VEPEFAFPPSSFLEVAAHQNRLTLGKAAAQTVLHCNMESEMNSQWGLEDLLADLHHARKRGDLGRLAFVAYCDVRRWAREAGRDVLAEQASRLITESPHQSRDAFLEQIDLLIRDLEALKERAVPATARNSSSTGWSPAPATA
jgi:hypothetical protein